MKGPSSSSDSRPPPSTIVFDGICTTVLLTSIGFLLGALFLILTTDYGLLYTNLPTTAEAYLRAEQTYLTLWTTPVLLKAFFHLILISPIFILCLKVSRYTEAALYFDGLCLAMILLVLGLYTGSTIPNIRRLTAAPSTEHLAELIQNPPYPDALVEFNVLSPRSYFDRFLLLLSNPGSILLKPQAALQREEEFRKSLEVNPVDQKTRQEILSVTAAGHSIAIFLLVGILVLQLGKIYAEAEDARLKANFELEESQKASQTKKDQ